MKLEHHHYTASAPFGFGGKTPYTNKMFWVELTAYFPWYDTDQTEN
jgi:hypothetical protein